MGLTSLGLLLEIRNAVDTLYILFISTFYINSLKSIYHHLPKDKIRSGSQMRQDSNPAPKWKALANAPSTSPCPTPPPFCELVSTVSIIQTCTQEIYFKKFILRSQMRTRMLIVVLFTITNLKSGGKRVTQVSNNKKRIK